METRNITLEAPTPALPLKGGGSFRHIIMAIMRLLRILSLRATVGSVAIARPVKRNDIAITTSNAAHSPRNDNTVLPCLRQFVMTYY